MKTRTDDSWTTRKLLGWTAQHLERKGVDSPKLAAEMLLAHVLEVPRINLFLDLDRPASPLERAAFRDLVERASSQEPVQYLVGEAHFFSLRFAVDRRVLIPRPSTETLVQHVVEHARRTPGFTDPLIADIGTGSGCIAVALAKNLPTARVIATDVCGEALEVAAANAARHGVAERIELRRGSLYEPVLAERFAFVVANPPYIPDEEWAVVEANVKDHEPTGALRGGPDGMEFLRPLIAEAHRVLSKPGQIVFEIASSRRKQALELAGGAEGLTNAEVHADLEGHPRMLVADRA